MENKTDWANTPVCQSCGMPLTSPDLVGRHADGSANPEYCVYCCPEGEARMQGTLEEMIACCAKIETDMGMFPDEATAGAHLAAYLPTLRRWKK